jgi:hypothetical protein
MITIKKIDKNMMTIALEAILDDRLNMTKLVFEHDQ